MSRQHLVWMAGVVLLSASTGRVQGQASTEPQFWKDSSTGLEWYRDPHKSSIDWKETGDYCRSLAAEGGAWRLPTIDELQFLYAGLDYSGRMSRFGTYWSSTETLEKEKRHCGSWKVFE